VSLSLYDLSVPSYLQTLGGVSNVLAKGEQHAAEFLFSCDNCLRHPAYAGRATGQDGLPGCIEDGELTNTTRLCRNDQLEQFSRSV
jgi:hypothetical protein